MNTHLTQKELAALYGRDRATIRRGLIEHGIKASRRPIPISELRDKWPDFYESLLMVMESRTATRDPRAAAELVPAR